MISRRGFFGMLAGLAASPAFAPVMKFFPETQQLARVYYSKEMIANLKRQMELRSPLMCRLRDTPKFYGGKEIKFYTFQCGTGEMGTLWWSKEKA